MYWVIGFNTNSSDKVVYFYVIMVCMYNSMSGVGYVLGAAISDKQTINILTPVLIVPLMLFTGFFVA
jgi:hypothetical protein